VLKAVEWRTSTLQDRHIARRMKLHYDVMMWSDSDFQEWRPPGLPLKTQLNARTYTCLLVLTLAYMCLHVPTCILLARAFVPLLVVTFRF